jgi:hypothetical protein
MKLSCDYAAKILCGTICLCATAIGLRAQVPSASAVEPPASASPAREDEPDDVTLDATTAFLEQVSIRKVHRVLEKRTRRNGHMEVGAEQGFAGLGWKWGLDSRDLHEMDRLEKANAAGVHPAVVEAAVAEVALTRWAHRQGMKEADRRLAAILGAVAGGALSMTDSSRGESFTEIEDRRREGKEASSRAWGAAREAVQRSLAREPSPSRVADEIDARWSQAAGAVRSQFGNAAGDTADELLRRHRDPAFLEAAYPAWARKHAKGDTLLSPAEFAPMEKQPSRKVAYGYISDSQPAQFFTFRLEAGKSISLHLGREAGRGATVSLDLLRANSLDEMADALWPGRGAEGNAGLFQRLGLPGEGKPGPVRGPVERVAMKSGKTIKPRPLNAAARTRLEKTDPERLRELELVTHPFSVNCKPGVYVLIVRAVNAGPQTSDRFILEIKGAN